MCGFTTLGHARWVEATKVGYRSLVCTKQVQALKPVTAHDYPPPPTALVAILCPCTCGPGTFDRTHSKWSSIDWRQPLPFIVCGDAYRCAIGSWTPSSIGLPNHGKWERTPAYLWVIGMAVCRDKEISALATLWAQKLLVLGPLVFH